MALPNFHRFSPTKGGWKVPTGQKLRFVKGQGYSTTPIPGYKAPAPVTMDSQINSILDKQFGESQSLIGKQAAQLQAEAASRQKNYQDAYAAAAKSNAAMGADVQTGWNQSGSAVQGLASALTGGIGAETQQGVASMDQALANVGAPATQFDPSTQAPVESYYGGYLPGREFAQMGGSGRQAMNELGIGLNTRGLQESLATQKNTNFEILKNQTAALADIAKARPGAYSDIRGLFATEKQNAISAQIARAELQANVWQQKADLRFRYDQLRQQAASDAEKNRLTADEIRLSNEIDKAALAIDKQNADTSRISANKPASSAASKYASGTYQQKMAAVIQDELENSLAGYVNAPKPAAGTRIPVISNATGKQAVDASGKPRTQPMGERAWTNNQRLAYREYIFGKMWPMVEGSVAKGNRAKAASYLRSKLWKVALSWDPNAVDAESGSTLPSAPAGTDDGVS